PVALGIVIYLNELLPTWDDIKKLRKDIQANRTDVIPAPGSSDSNIIQMRKPQKSSPNYKLNRALSWEFRTRRALRLEPILPADVDESLSRFDRYLRLIEVAHSKEKLSGQILPAWPKNNSDPDTCAACDFQT